jgi:hypothetical protein
VSKCKTRQARAQEHAASIKKALKPKRKKVKDISSTYSPKTELTNWCNCPNFQETSLRTNCCVSSTPHAAGLTTTKLLEKKQ